MSPRGGAWVAEEGYWEAGAEPTFRSVFQCFTNPFGHPVAYKLIIRPEWEILGVLTGSRFDGCVRRGERNIFSGELKNTPASVGVWRRIFSVRAILASRLTQAPFRTVHLLLAAYLPSALREETGV